MTKITKSALAVELKVTRARISQMITAGLPVEKDGRIIRERALGWVRRNASVGGGGGWELKRDRLESGELAGRLIAIDGAVDDAAAREQEASLVDLARFSMTRLAAKTRNDFRAVLPGLLAPMRASLTVKVSMFALIDSLLEAWHEELTPPGPTAIEWSVFGSRSDEARALFDSLLEYFRRCEDNPEVA